MPPAVLLSSRAQGPPRSAQTSVSGAHDVDQGLLSLDVIEAWATHLCLDRLEPHGDELLGDGDELARIGAWNSERRVGLNFITRTAEQLPHGRAVNLAFEIPNRSIDRADRPTRVLGLRAAGHSPIEKMPDLLIQGRVEAMELLADRVYLSGDDAGIGVLRQPMTDETLICFHPNQANRGGTLSGNAEP